MTSPTFGTAEEAAYRAYLADEALDVYMSAQADEQATHLAYVAAVARSREAREAYGASLSAAHAAVKRLTEGELT